jgi:2-polyprenyl-3-methyl-5-hydroxy-6-metoxy-1,4-benzoquinol methylase
MPRAWSVCPLCGGSDHLLLWSHEPARYIEGRVVRCNRCKTMFKIPSALSKPIGEYYTTRASAEAHELDDEEYATTEFAVILDRLSAGLGHRRGRLLDLGCGAGQFMQMAQSAGFAVTGIEINETVAARARQRTGAKVFTTNLESEGIPGADYNVVAMLDVIEHVQDPLALLRCVRESLARDGRLVVFTPNHDSVIARVARNLDALSFGRIRGPVDQIFDSMHVTFFTVATLRKTLEAARFKVQTVDLIRYAPERRSEASGLTATALRALETVSPFLPGGRFRILMIAEPLH